MVLVPEAAHPQRSQEAWDGAIPDQDASITQSNADLVWSSGKIVFLKGLFLSQDLGHINSGEYNTKVISWAKFVWG
jgi:hypothetical protein